MQPGRARERRILVGLCVLIGINQLGFGAIIPVLPLYAQSFGVSQAAIGATIAVFGLARMVSAAPTGRLADFAGRRVALASGGLLSALGNLWCAIAESYAELLAARFVAGIGAGLALTAGMIVLADISTPARRGRTMAIYQGVFIFAVGIGPLPGGFLAETFNLAAPFYAFAAASVAAAAVGWFAIAESRPAMAATAAGSKVSPGYLNQVRALLGNRGFMLASGISLMNALARTGGLFSIVPVIGRDQLNLSASQIGLGLAIGSTIGLLLTYPAGTLVDLYGRKPMIVPTTIAAGLAILLFALAPSYSWFLAACVVWGSATAASGAAPAAYAADIAPPGMNATAMGAFRTIADSGYVIGPILLGILGDAYGLSVPLWIAAAGMVAIGVLFAVYAPETYAGSRRQSR